MRYSSIVSQSHPPGALVYVSSHLALRHQRHLSVSFAARRNLRPLTKYIRKLMEWLKYVRKRALVSKVVNGS